MRAPEAALLGLARTLDISAFHLSIRQRSGGLTVGAARSSLFPADICFPTAVPTPRAIIGASTRQIFGLTGQAITRAPHVTIDKIRDFTQTFESKP